MSSLGWLTQPAVFPWIALLAGLCAGSFLNVVIYRLPRMLEREWLADVPEILEQARELPDREGAQRLAAEIRQATARIGSEPLGLVAPRSRCPSCGHRIPAWENIPVLSWLALRGKCSACGAPISVRYPAVELLAGIGAAYAAWRFGFGLAALAAALFLWATIALAFIDQATGYLPDDITLPLLWAGLLANAFGAFVPLGEAVLGAAAGYLFLWLVYWGYKLATGKEGMGHGDFKMNAAVGAFLGWKMLPLVILLSSLVGVVFGLVQMFAARGGWDGSFKFHFGPYLAIAGIVAMFWGQAIMALVPAIRAG
jgi:leader peptidase (prepilin peptidase)/N-methyltransferase